MKKFLFRLLYLIPIPVFIISINYFEDPANLFDKKYESGIADYFVQGYNVTNLLNYNERLLQKLFIQKMTECPNEIALGSSTMMLINSSYSKKSKFINNGVSGCALEDQLAIYYLYEEKGCKIEKIILGLDPWLLNDGQDGRWIAIGDEYYNMLKKLVKDTSLNHEDFIASKNAKYKELLSLSYFKASFNYFLKRIDKTYKPTKIAVNEGLTRLNDGSISYDAPYRNASPITIEQKAKKTIANNTVYHYDQFTGLSPKYISLFSRFIEYLQQQNIEVEFFMAPYHPILYNYFKQNNYYHVIFDADNYFRNFANSHKIKIMGSYDPEKYHLDNTFFFDGIHCNEKAIEKIFNEQNK